MNKILILTALMLTGCDYSVEMRNCWGCDDRVCVGKTDLFNSLAMSRIDVACLPLGDINTAQENIKKMKALADELNGLEK